MEYLNYLWPESNIFLTIALKLISVLNLIMNES